jgi:hypothetical protein
MGDGEGITPEDERLRGILERVQVIAVVGASADEAKPAHTVPARMAQAGFRVIPVNPTIVGQKLWGEKVLATLQDIREHVDMVDVFRRPALTPAVARDAVEIGADVLWLQQGITSEEARNIAEDGGLEYVEDRCMAVERARFQIDK